MKLIKRIGALLITVAMLCSLIVIVPNNVTTVKALEGAGPQGYVSSHIYEGCDLSFWNVNDGDYAYNGALDDSGADYSLLDFDKMKADGCDFVILRIGSEDSSGKYVDPHFYTLYDMAREAGLDLGLYYYSYATTYAGAVEEAEFVINAIEEAGMYFEYPIYYDVEESDQLTTSIAPTICQAWCDTMIANGYFPGLYGNYALHDVLTDDILNTYDFWLAYVSTQEGVSSYNPSNMNLSSDCAVWQYSFYGYGWDGIYYYSSSVGALLLDSNVSYKDYPAIMAQYGYNNVDSSASSIPESYKPTVDADGNYTFENAYGYVFEIDDVDGVIEGEDATIITNADAYSACNPNWAISVQLRPTETDGEYEVVKVVPTPGSAEAAGLTWEDNDIVMVVHSANSQPGYANWISKVAALTLKEGDIVTVSDDMTTVTIPDLDGDDPVEPTEVVINSIELTTTSAVVAGNTIFTPTVKSINGDTSLATAATSATLTQWYEETGTTQYASGTVFEEGVVYDLYFKLTCNSGYSFSDSCVMTIETANGTFTGEYYSSTSDATNRAYDFMITAAAAGTTEPTETVISSIELSTTDSAAAGNALFTPTLKSINGNADIIGAATSAISVQWYDETATTPLYSSSTNFEEGVVYDLFIRVTRSDEYTFADTVVYTLTTADGTYTGVIDSNYTTDTVHAFDFMVTGLAASGSTDPEEPVEKFVIESLEFEVNAFDPAVGNTVFSPTLVSVNGDAELLKYIEENHTKWYTITGATVTEYNNTTFEALNIGFKYDLYFSITPTDEAEFTESTTLKLTTSSRTHNATLYTFDTETGTISFDIYFETETVAVPDQSVFITGFNTSIVAGAAQIFTPDFGTVSNSTANVTWTANAIAKYDEELDAYVVTELIFPTESGCTVDRTLADDEIFIAVHWDDSETDGLTEANRNALMAVQPGMLLEFNNIDLDSQTIGSNPTIEFYTLAEPVVSLGAKANESLYGIRFGATYNKVFGYGEVTGLGFLLISEYRLGDNALDLNYASNSAIAEYVVNVEARTIVEYVEGKDFSEYETFTFYASVVRLDRKNNLDDNIVAVPYITYASGKTVIGKQMMNNYNGVLAGNSSF